MPENYQLSFQVPDGRVAKTLPHSHARKKAQTMSDEAAVDHIELRAGIYRLRNKRERSL